MGAYDEWRTPPDLFAQLHNEFGFTVDVAAASWNHQLPRFWDSAVDGLRQDWSRERAWCNPPFSNPLPWVGRARSAELAVVLLPIWGRQPWLGRALEWASEFRDLGHVAFSPPSGVSQGYPMWRTGLFIFRRP